MDTTGGSSLSGMSAYERKAWRTLIEKAAKKDAGRKFMPRQVTALGHAVSGRAATAWDATPGTDSLEEVLSSALEGLHAATTTQGLRSVNTDKVIRSFQAAGHQVTVLADLRVLDLEACDSSLPRHRRGYPLMAAAQGAGTSLMVTGAIVATTVTAGTTATVAVAAIAADVTATLVGMGRIVALVGARYGFDVSSPEEGVFAAGVLTFAVAQGTSLQFVSLTSLSRLTQLMMRNATWKQLQSEQLVNIVYTVFKSLGLRLTHKKLGQAVPVLGVLINGGLNYQQADQTFRRAMQAYRLRFLTEKYGLDPAQWTASFGEPEPAGGRDDLPRVDDILEAELADLDIDDATPLPAGPTSPLPEADPPVALWCDSDASVRRRTELTAYMDRHVLGPGGFCCSSADDCRTSAMTRAEPIDFAAGQLSHLGQYYDVYEDDVPLRVLVIGMETGRADVGITLPMRRRQVLDNSAALPPRSRNPHMVGVTHALRTLFGRPVGDDDGGEHLDLGLENGSVHLFDAFAMANVRLCTSVRAGTTQSRPTAVMTKNCVPHLLETVRILQPTICVVQSTAIPAALARYVTDRRQISSHLSEVTIGGVRTLMAEFSHPTAYAELNWGRWTNMPYLQDTVVPTLKEARVQLGLPPAAT
jgi:EcsC protein family